MDALSIRDEIEALLKQFPDYRPNFCEIRKNNWKQLKYENERRFIQKKHFKEDLHWAWLRFKEPYFAVSFVGPVFNYLDGLINEKEVYFVVED